MSSTYLERLRSANKAHDQYQALVNHHFAYHPSPSAIGCILDSMTTKGMKICALDHLLRVYNDHIRTFDDNSLSPIIKQCINKDGIIEEPYSILFGIHGIIPRNSSTRTDGGHCALMRCMSVCDVTTDRIDVIEAMLEPDHIKSIEDIIRIIEIIIKPDDKDAALEIIITRCAKAVRQLPIQILAKKVLNTYGRHAEGRRDMVIALLSAPHNQVTTKPDFSALFDDTDSMLMETSGIDHPDSALLRVFDTIPLYRYRLKYMINFFLIHPLTKEEEVTSLLAHMSSTAMKVCTFDAILKYCYQFIPTIHKVEITRILMESERNHSNDRHVAKLLKSANNIKQEEDNMTTIMRCMCIDRGEDDLQVLDILLEPHGVKTIFNITTILCNFDLGSMKDAALYIMLTRCRDVIVTFNRNALEDRLNGCYRRDKMGDIVSEIIDSMFMPRNNIDSIFQSSSIFTITPESIGQCLNIHPNKPYSGGVIYIHEQMPTVLHGGAPIQIMSSASIVNTGAKTGAQSIQSALELIASRGTPLPEHFMGETVPYKQQTKVEQVKKESSNDDILLCSICLDNMKNVLLNDCRHLCVCDTCVVGITTNDITTCPICKAKNTKTTTVFL
jgi:hypothetical protein